MNMKVQSQPQTYAARLLQRQLLKNQGQHEAARAIKGTGPFGMLKGMFNLPQDIVKECMDVIQGDVDPEPQGGAGERTAPAAAPSLGEIVTGIPVNPQIANLVHARKTAPAALPVAMPAGATLASGHEVSDRDAARVWPHVRDSAASRLRNETDLSPEQSETVLREIDTAMAATGNEGSARTSGDRARGGGGQEASAGTWEGRVRERLEREGKLSPEQIGQVIQILGDIIRQGMQQIANTLMEASKSAAAHAVPSNAGSRS